jgi:hypothetical protein
LEYSIRRSEAMERFLIAQEKNLKKLTVMNGNLSFLGALKDLRLEYLNIGECYQFPDPSLQFLKH